MFADDTKVYNTIKSDMDQNNLQTAIDKIYNSLVNTVVTTPNTYAYIIP